MHRQFMYRQTCTYGYSSCIDRCAPMVSALHVAGKMVLIVCRNEWQVIVITTAICECLNYLMCLQLVYLYSYDSGLGPGTLLVHNKHFTINNKKKCFYTEWLVGCVVSMGVMQRGTTKG